MNTDVVESYLHHLAAERRLSPHTLAAYRRDLAVLTDSAGVRPLAELGADDIRRIVVALRADALSPASIARHLSAWRGLYVWACRRLGFPANPCIGVRPPKAAQPLPDLLSPDACSQLLDVSVDRPLELRDHAMFELLYSSGLRLAELVGLDLARLDLRAGEASVTGKGSKTRLVPVGRQAREALSAWLAVRPALAQPDVPAVFVNRRGQRLGARSVQLRLARWAVRAGVPQHVHPHLLRHAFATHLLQSSGDLRAVQELLGHANLATTQVYTHLDWQHLARTYDEAHPRARRKSGGEG